MVRLIQWPPAYGPDGLAGCPPDLEAVQETALMLATRPGERPDAPDFGLATPLGGLAYNHEGIRAAVRRWLPRHTAAVTATHQVDPDGTQWVQVTVTREDQA